jgi:hypothetical protein
LTEIRSLRKTNFESVLEFTQRLNKLYNKIPTEVKPSQLAAKVTFARPFEPDFSLLLRERRYATLEGMQDDSIEIESNMMASRKLKTKVEMGTKEPRHLKEQVRPSGSRKSLEENIDPKMVKISKYLPTQMKNKYAEFLRQYKDVFSWSYDDLKTYDTFVIGHKIPLKHGIKPFR